MRPDKPGRYWYYGPGWDRPLWVEVKREDGELVVQFNRNTYPVALKNIPAGADFKDAKQRPSH